MATESFTARMKHKAQGYQERTWRGLRNDLFPALGARPINHITATELLMALRKVEARGAVDMAHRVKQTAGQVFRYGVATGRCERDPTGDLKGALQTVNKTHFTAITNPKEVGTLVVKTALLLSAILFQRPGEMRSMEWGEINWEEERWELPVEKMKMEQPHIVQTQREL